MSIVNNLLCYYTEKDDSTKVRRRRYDCFVNPRKGRSSPSQMFFIIGVLTNFANLNKKAPVLESLFNKVAGSF